MKRLNFYFMAIGLIILSACASKGYKVEGEVEGGGSEDFIVLERADPNGGWLTLDSVKLSDGKFEFSGEPIGAPEIFRLRMGSQYIYLPVDSTETVTVKTHAGKFATDFTLSGSDDALQMERFEKELLSFIPLSANADSLKSFKRRIYSEFLKDARGSVVSYYILTKTIGNTPLYEHAEDYKYFAAVATSFRQYRPNDPRTALLEQVGMEGMRRHNAAAGKQKVVEAEELAFIDLELPDEQGNLHKLSEIAGKGKTTVLVFANMTEESSPELHMQLRSLAESGKANIYEVSFDADRYDWRNAAANLPWATVWSGDVTSASNTTRSYNLQRVPVFFIIDSNGQLVDRADDINALKNKINTAERH
ncbi:MAG: DUF4369 domain-containing protein [Clostridium sp.]|nr:DUF4369 domain-containing protein [Prevotella sp.]MCM1428388.1 DUF4369 domain-containing protein [Clostridium sp.]MCM1474860.1 DUF4369 domain-containing protein [Muribaculaceae bacterium]